MTNMTKQTEALREAQQPAPVAKPRKQEPVAYLVDGDLYYPEEIDWETLHEQGHTVAALYTSPQAQRTWVRLTDEDIKEAEWLLSAIKEHEAYTLQEQLLVEGVDVFARAIEAKLREKNGITKEQT